MKKLILVLLSVFTSLMLNAQIKTITGSVKDPGGIALHFVFVGNNNEDKVATFTDSLGNFSLEINNAKGLYFSLIGFRDTSLNLTDKKTLQIVLYPGALSSGQTALSAAPVQQSAGNDALSTIGTGGGIAPSHQQGALHGSRYLFDTFVHGFVINTSGELVHGPNYQFDYDKISGGLLLTIDNQHISLVGWDLTQKFTLFTDQDQTMVFAKVPAIDQSHYVQLLESGKKYNIYKLIKTTFIKADYVNTGVSSHGNDFDSYDDNAEYYLYDTQTNGYHKFFLRKKSIKEAYVKEGEKLNNFFSDHDNDKLDDTYLEKLGDYMNN